MVTSEDAAHLTSHTQAADHEGVNLLQETAGSIHRTELTSEVPQEEIALAPIQTEEDLIGAKGSKIWKTHFAPSIHTKEIIQATTEHNNTEEFEPTEVTYASST